MNKLLFIFTIAILFIACEDDQTKNDNQLFGQWKLIEQLMDPGNGSGTYQSVESDKIITFYSDNTFTSNGDMCFVSSESDQDQTGIFTDSTIVPNANCGIVPYPIRYTITGDYLELFYTCIEPCQQKWQKIE